MYECAVQAISGKNVVLLISFVFASLRAFWNWDILESDQTDAALAVSGIFLNAFFSFLPNGNSFGYL